MIAGIETGGTKVICALASEQTPQEIIAIQQFPTTTPTETIGLINAWLEARPGGGQIEGLGVASFGPIVTDRKADDWGWITDTTKPGWRDFDLIGAIGVSTLARTRLVTDVTGAALGESKWGAGKGHDDLAYATFGTGVGVGLLSGGEPFPAAGELGHLMVRRHPADRFDGMCPFHGDCIEGLAAGPAIMRRWGADASSLPPELAQTAIEIEAYYIAQLAAIVLYTLGSTRIIVGGGVSKTPGLMKAVREQFNVITGGPNAGHGRAYSVEDYIVRPTLGDESGVRGALELAWRAWADR